MSYKSKYTGLQIDDILDSVEGKQNEIEDLASIRSGAAKGATALQSYTEKYTGTITGIKMNGVSKGTSGVVDLGTVITAHQDISGKADKSSLATVATSGSYNDLSNKPTIPSAVTESTVSGWGFTKNTGTYSKPSTGIPKTDLASAVQTSLGKADTALQSYTEQYKGTVTGVKINGTTKNPSSGVVDLGTVITSHQDISGKQDKLVSGTNIKTINGTSILGSGDITISSGEGDYLPSEGGTITGNLTVMGEIASPTRIFATGGVQGYLRSGDYILGIKYGGDIVWGIEPLDEHYITASGDGTKFLSNDGTYKTISGGSSSGGSGVYAEVNHGTSDTTFTLTPNTFHVWDEVSELTLTLGDETAGVANEFLFQFTSGSEPTVLTLPDNIKWTEELTIEPNRIYQVSILKGLASVLSWKIAKIISFNVNTDTYYAKEGMTWEQFVNSSYNTDQAFYIYYDYVYHSNSGANVMETGMPVSITDFIIEDGSYIALPGGGGSGN